MAALEDFEDSKELVNHVSEAAGGEGSIFDGISKHKSAAGGEKELASIISSYRHLIGLVHEKEVGATEHHDVAAAYYREIDYGFVRLRGTWPLSTRPNRESTGWGPRAHNIRYRHCAGM